MGTQTDYVSLSGDAYEYTHSIDVPYRNVRRLRIEHLTMPILREELYVTVQFPELGISFPLFYDDRYNNYNDGATMHQHPLSVTDHHYHDFESPLGMLHRLKVQLVDSDGRVVSPEMTNRPGSASFFLVVSVTYDPRDARVPPPDLNRTYRTLRMFDYRFSDTDLSAYRMTFDFPDALKRVSKVRLLGLHVPPMPTSPSVTLELEGVASFPVHYDYWHTPSDMNLSRVRPELHVSDLHPPQNVPKWTLRVAKEDGSTATIEDTHGFYGVYALFDITYGPRSLVD